MTFISTRAILLFSFTSGLTAIATVLIIYFCLSYVSFGELTSIVVAILFITILYSLLILIYRIFLMFLPLHEGVIKPGSKLEFTYHFYLLNYLIFFNSLTKTHVIPIPFRRLIYQLLGATFGKHSYCSGAILDPPLTRIGSHSLLGHDCVVFAHAIESDRLLYHAAIHIGNHVTVGAKAIIMPGVTIEDHAIVAAGAVVTKGTVIGNGELWAGVPAKRIRRLF